MNIKNNFPSILTITLLTLTVGFLFLYGNSKIKKAEKINSTVLAWENLSNKYDSTEDLNLTVQNITPDKITYQIEWLLNNEKIDSAKIELKTRTTKTVQPTKKVLTSLAELSKNNQEVLYQVKITEGKNPPQTDERTGKSETLGKRLK